jgi:hypothetical protein
MDDQTANRAGGDMKHSLPHFSIRSLLGLFPLLALWLVSARLGTAGEDMRKALLLLMVVASGALAVYT